MAGDLGNLTRRQSFAALAGLAAVAAGYTRAESQDLRELFKTEFTGYNSPRSLHWPTGPHITTKDYPPMNSAIAEDVPADWNRSTSQGGSGGIDFAAKHDGSTKVVPAAIGEVTWAGYDNHNGWSVVLHNGLYFHTNYAHMQKLNDKKVKKGAILTPEDEIGNAGNEGSGAKGYFHLYFSLIVPSYIEPNHVTSLLSGKRAYSVDPARFAEYCVVGKDIGGGKRVKVCNFSINYRQGPEYDTKLWEADKEYREFTREVRRSLPEEVRRQYREQRDQGSYYDRGSFFESQLKTGFGGHLSEKQVAEFLQRLEHFKSLRPILTAPIANPYKPELYKR